MTTGRIFVISAPSGTGKTTISQRLLRDIPDLVVSISTTTRRPRPGEKDGVDYHFVTPERFQAMVERNEFAEWARVYAHCYGTPKSFLKEQLRHGRNVILTIDTQGGLKIKKVFPDAVLIGLLPPSMEEQEARMRRRAGGTPETEIKERLDWARRERKTLFACYDYRFVNKRLESTVAKIKKLISR